MSSKKKNTYPSLRHLTSKDYGKIPDRFNQKISAIGKPHIESYNYLLHGGLQRAVEAIPPVEFEAGSSQISIKIEEAAVSVPLVPVGTTNVRTLYVYPSECRQRATTYNAKLVLTLSLSKNGIKKGIAEKVAGDIPIMLKSTNCHLAKLTPTELIARGEDANEFGGYFIVNGQEKLFRILIVPRRNHPIAISRPSWKNRGKFFSEYGVYVRCIKDNHSGIFNVLHYLTDGTAKLMFSLGREMFFMPVCLILKALCNVNDISVFKQLTHGIDDSHYQDCIKNMLRQLLDQDLILQSQILNYIGEKFRTKLLLPSWYTDKDVAVFLLREHIAIHLDDFEDKFNFLVLMTRKLFAVATGQKAIESVDNPMNQELLLGGHLFLMMLKEKLTDWLQGIRIVSNKFAKNSRVEAQFEQASDLTFMLSKMNNITGAMQYTLATGNLATKNGLGLQERSGLAIVLEKINFMRYVSHFQCVHRGSFFAQMRTTDVRKLLPEAWGFICPVHTPDGTPCGLLNHLTASCKVTTSQPSTRSLRQLLCNIGMFPVDVNILIRPTLNYPVMLDGEVVGFVDCEEGLKFCETLRYLKAREEKGEEEVPKFLEIVLVPTSKYAAQYPGIFLFTSDARMMRPVQNLRTLTTEYIGTMEQVYLNIAVVPEEIYPKITTHLELKETAILSTLASLTPFSDFNQSPRNMYQCQMCKQSMGTPSHQRRKKPDKKMYLLQTPSSPLVKPAAYDEYDLTDYPMGLNAIVAVISYTGYDMEDAMTINKSSLERGFAHGCIYKTEHIELKSSVKGKVDYIFGVKSGNTGVLETLDPDGLPFVGCYLEHGKPFYSYLNLNTGEMTVESYRSAESGYVDDVRLLGNDNGTQVCQKVCITIRIPRNPIIGDKFASRHGQKGICSQKWPQEDMPFTESGMVPDIIFNPHGFPSRMTIGMMIESMAGKSAALHGLVHDATPFTFSEDQPASEYFGELLRRGGYNYYGTERMYSGVDGREMEADIFFGVVYYQRLRHMVADKFQVRTTGPVDSITRQPIKGRKRGGGIRFGEMERDALLAHGTAFLVQDRLLNCSDRSVEYICTACGSILSPELFIPEKSASDLKIRAMTCRLCGRQNTIEAMAIPYVLKYFACELAAVNIKFRIRVKPD